MKTITLFCLIIAHSLSMSCGLSKTIETANLNVEQISLQQPSDELSQNRNPDNFLVVAGESIGAIHLNDKLEDVFKIFPFIRNYDALHKESVYKTPEGIFECAGVFRKNIFNGQFDRAVAFYYKNESVVQIEGESSKFYMKNGIKSGDSLSSLLKKCKECKTYILKGSGGEKVGGKDFIYLVNEQEGVAFEMRYDKKQKRRTLDRFIVFNKNSPFLPETCVTPPQSFEAIQLDSNVP